MKVKVYGFDTRVVGAEGTVLGLPSFMDWLDGHAGDVVTDFEGHDRVLIVRSARQWVTGLLLTVRDQRRFFVGRKQGTTYRINVRDLEQGTSLLELNHFVLSKKTGKGLYEQYHLSCTARVFGKLLHRRFADYREEDLTAALEQAGEVTGREKREIKKKYGCGLKFEPQVVQEKVEELLKNLAKVSGIKFSFRSRSPKDPFFQPIKDRVASHSTVISFSRENQPLAVLKEELAAMIKSRKFSSGKVWGQEEDGAQRSYDLIENASEFAEYEWEDLADELGIDLAEPEKYDVRESRTTKRLLAIARKHGDLFSAEEE